MLDTFIKNKGITKTIIHNNNKNYYNEVQWDADYDGENANLSLDIDENGNKEHLQMKVNNEQLIELLNIPSENITLDKRLYNDFLSNRPKKEYKIIELPKSILHNNLPFPKDSYQINKKRVHFKNENDPLDDTNYYTHISSPASQEELLFPLVVNETKTRKHKNHKHKNPKSHVTYKVYRKNKHPSLSSSSSSSRKTLRRHKHHHNGHSRRTF
jgi:hypothetical protein